MMITRIGEPYQEGKRRLIDAWAIEKRTGPLAFEAAPGTGAPGKRGRFREFTEKKRTAEGEM